RQYLERRLWQIVTPMGKIVSEPWDLDYLSERNIGDIGAYTGVLPAGSTTSNVVFDQPVTLESSVTYLLIVQKRDNSPAQSRTVSTGAGTWMSLAMTSPFAVAPAEGDWYAMGQLNLDHIVTRCQDVKIDGSGRVSQVRTEYNELVYTPDPLPS